MHLTCNAANSFFFLIFIYLFIWLIGSYLWHAGSLLQHVESFVVMRGLFIAAHGLLSSCGLRALECTGSVVVARGLSCPAACGILVPQPQIKPVSPALEGRFLTTGPPRKSCKFLLYVHTHKKLESLQIAEKTVSFICSWLLIAVLFLFQLLNNKL